MVIFEGTQSTVRGVDQLTIVVAYPGSKCLASVNDPITGHLIHVQTMTSSVGRGVVDASNSRVPQPLARPRPGQADKPQSDAGIATAQASLTENSWSSSA